MKKEKLSAQEKRWEKGKTLYDEFVETFTEMFDLPPRVSTPRTTSLEKFALLAKHPNHKSLLYREMTEEYFSNFIEVKLSVEKGRLYERYEVKQPW